MIKQTYLSTQYFTQSERNIQLNFFIFLFKFRFREKYFLIRLRSWCWGPYPIKEVMSEKDIKNDQVCYFDLGHVLSFVMISIHGSHALNIKLFKFWFLNTTQQCLYSIDSWISPIETLFIQNFVKGENVAKIMKHFFIKTENQILNFLSSFFFCC